MKLPDFIQTALAALKTSYALVDQAGQIVDHDPLFPAWVMGQPDNLVGTASLVDLLPELVGQEEALERVRRGDLPFLRLENINRPEPAGFTRYLTLTVITLQPNSTTTLAVFVTDVTEQGQYVQQLMQSRNELQLARHKLAKLNDQLDYLLHHYLSPEVAAALLEGKMRPEVGGELRQTSLLFADVRNFTSLAEKLSPKRMVQLLNDYLNIIAEVTDEVDGTISQFQGDRVMVMFNAPLDQPDHARRAVQAGITLQQVVAAYRLQRPPEEPRLHFGVGIHTGPALLGNIGPFRRLTYTASGNTVNLAARITAAVPTDEVWLSQTTYEHLQGAIAVEPLPPLTSKGKSDSIPLFRVCL